MSNEEFFITVDSRHLRIFKESKDILQREPSLTLIEAFDIVEGRSKYVTGQETSMAGRFPAERGPGLGGGPGMSIDERLPMQEEQERRIAAHIAQYLAAFFAARPDAGWHFAAGPGLLQAVLERLPAAVIGQLREAIQKELANLPPSELLSHFAHH
jgi:hypothetical protein